MKFISLRDVVLLCYSSNMAAANTLYCSLLLIICARAKRS